MFKKFLILCLIYLAVVRAGLIPEHGGTAIITSSHPVSLEVDTSPHYEFQYSVHDSHTGDIKDQFEHRRGDYVTGRYSLIEPDGHRRVVEYSSDPYLGFQAQVRRELPAVPAYNVEEPHPVAGQNIGAAIVESVESWPPAAVLH